MKRIFTFIVLCVMISSFTIPVFAETDYSDLFYYEMNDKLQQVIDGDVSYRLRTDTEYLENYYLPKGEKADPTKITHDTSKMYAFYIWDFEKVIEFMKSEDKKGYLDTLSIYYLMYPCYYDGVLLTDYKEEYIIIKKTNKYRVLNDGRPNYGYSTIHQDKDILVDTLEEGGFGEYNVIQSIRAYNLYFAITEKDGEFYAIHLPNEEDAKYDVYKDNKEILEKRVLTIEDLELMNKQIEESAKNSNSSFGLEEGSDINETKPVSNYMPLIYIASAVVIISVTTMLVIIIRKQKS